MIPAQLQSRDRELREAIARRDYDRLNELLAGLRREADEHMARAADAAERRRIAGWVLATIEWARLMLTTQRQRWADELEALPRVDRFLAGAGAPASDVCLDL
jgi:hypothetical protein